MAVDRSKQGTAFSGFEADDQTSIQRSRFAEIGTIYGASSNNVTNIFTHADRPTPQYIMQRAVGLMGNNMSIPAGENPDFNSRITHSQMTFQDGVNKFDSIGQVADKPSLLGPNLSVPDMENIPDDTTTADPNQATVVPPNSDGTFTNYGDAGYGISIDRNNPDHLVNPTSQTFLSRRGASVANVYTSRTTGQETLGEYLDSDTYNYTE